MSYVLRWARK